MSAPLAAAGCLGLAALVLAWPNSWRPGRLRLNRVLGAGPAAAANAWARWYGRVRRIIFQRPFRPAPDGSGIFTSRVPVLTTVALVATALAAAFFTSPVAALAVAAYGGLAIGLRRSRKLRSHQAVQRRAQLDQLSAAAADLRAGLPASVALPAGGADLPAGPESVLPARMRTAAALAERTGAPLADLLDRVESDARATDRAHGSAAAQAAGAQATAWLLAALPVGGLVLGLAIGADPFEVLLHTPLGAACLAGAIVLQLAGLAWTGRLLRGNGAAT